MSDLNLPSAPERGECAVCMEYRKLIAYGEPGVLNPYGRIFGVCYDCFLTLEDEE